MIRSFRDARRIQPQRDITVTGHRLAVFLFAQGVAVVEQAPVELQQEVPAVPVEPLDSPPPPTIEGAPPTDAAPPIEPAPVTPAVASEAIPQAENSTTEPPPIESASVPAVAPGVDIAAALEAAAAQ